MSDFIFPVNQEVYINLDAALVNHEIGGVGDFLKVIELTHPEVNVTVRVQDPGGAAHALIAGQTVNAKPGVQWNRIFISTDTAATGGYMKLEVSNGLEFGGIPKITPDIVNEEGNTASVTVADTQTLLTAGVTLRQNLLVVNTDTTKTLWFGFDGVTAGAGGDGIPILPGANLPFVVAANVKCYGITETGTLDARVLEGR
jgi:hypothetical protein